MTPSSLVLRALALALLLSVSLQAAHAQPRPAYRKTVPLVATTAQGPFDFSQDVDRDGDPDMIMAGEANFTWLNNGELLPSFMPMAKPQVPNYSQEYGNWLAKQKYKSCEVIDYQDLDGDGRRDLLLKLDLLDKDEDELNTYSLAWGRNKGGNPTAYEVQDILRYGSEDYYEYDSDEYLSGLKLIDLNKDGDLDILYTLSWHHCNDLECKTGQDCGWFENTSDKKNRWKQRYYLDNSYRDYHAVAEMVDMNNDGLMDVKLLAASTDEDVASYFDEVWHVLINQGGSVTKFNRVMSTAIDVTNGNNLMRCDLDRDGDQDWISCEMDYIDYSPVLWLNIHENKGGVISKESREIYKGMGGSGSSYKFWDYDRDGDQDILVFGHDDSRSHFDDVELVENLGNLNFKVAYTFPEAWYLEPWLADMDGDGDDDLFYRQNVNYVFKVFVLENRGKVAGKAEFSLLNEKGFALNYKHKMDFDRDGDLDFIGGDRSGLHWYEAQKGATLEYVKKTLCGNPADVQRDPLYVFDADQDGDTDLVTNSAQGVEFFQNQGSPAMQFRVTRLSSPGTLTPQGLIDINHDGYLDIYGLQQTAVGGGQQRNTLCWIPNMAAPKFTAGPTQFTRREINTPVLGAEALCLADLDGDKKTDLIAASPATGSVYWLRNKGGKPAAFESKLIATGLLGPADLAAGDLDRDGDLDLAVAARGNNSILWLENSGGARPSFARRVLTSNATGACAVTLADMNNDGHLDVLAASPGDNSLRLFTNDRRPDPSFSEKKLASKAKGISSLATDLLNGTLLQDIVYAAPGENKLVWLAQGANQKFTFRTIDAQVPGVTSLSVADLNGDGLKDLLVTSTADKSLAWYQCSLATFGTPVYTRRLISNKLPAPSSAVARDLDWDGDLDLVVTAGNTMNWFDNDGKATPTFSVRTIDKRAKGLREGLAGDLDGDGDLDLVGTASGLDRVLWYENQRLPLTNF